MNSLCITTPKFQIRKCQKNNSGFFLAFSYLNQNFKVNKKLIRMLCFSVCFTFTNLSYEVISKEITHPMINFTALETINSHLQKLEGHLKNNNYKETCYESKNAIKTIDINSNELISKEPYYNWKEIKDVLNLISKNSCTRHLRSN